MCEHERQQLAAQWMLKGTSLLNRKRSQDVKKTSCLCENAIDGAKVEGDRLCGGREMVLEIRESRGRGNGHAQEATES